MPGTPRFIARLTQTQVPLPAKVFLSYLLVIVVGAVPTYFFLRELLLGEFTNESVRTVAIHAQLLANFLSDIDDTRARVLELQHISPTLVERATYITSTGRVLFESSLPDVHSLDNHLSRPEIERALGHLPPDESIDVQLPRVGISRRPADTTRVDTLYVAVRLSTHAGNDDFLRLGVPMSELDRLSILLTRVLRNSQAAAVSISILLSLLAAVYIMRPLQRLASVARALAVGDYTVQVGDLGRDEIGNVGKSLEQLATELRRRMAVAQAGEAMLVQLVHGMHFPMAVFGPDGNVVAINGAARDAFSRAQSSADANFAHFVQSDAFTQALHQAHQQGEPIHLTYTTRDGSMHVSGWVQVLRHPAGPPFCAFLGEEAVRRPMLRLPRHNELRPVSLGKILDEVQNKIAPILATQAFKVQVDGAIPEAPVCDHQGRVELAVVTTLCGVLANAGQTVPVVIVEKTTRVGLVIYAPVSDPAVETAAFLLNPIGGRIKSNHDRCIVFLAKA